MLSEFFVFIKKGAFTEAMDGILCFGLSEESYSYSAIEKYCQTNNFSISRATIGYTVNIKKKEKTSESLASCEKLFQIRIQETK